MQVRQLLSEDDAVSPVIGVILMVAITVILAAVIASFVLGLGDQQQTTPTISFTTDYSDFDGNQGNLTIAHDGGDTVRADEIYIRGSNGTNGGNAVSSYNHPWIAFANATGPNHVYSTSSIGYAGTNSSSKAGTKAIVAGDSITFPTGSDAEIDVVYDPVDSDTTATLTEWSGPDA